MPAKAAHIHFGLNSSNSAPLLYQYQNPNLATGGFLYEISVAIAVDLKQNYTIVTQPRNRIAEELIAGEVDLTCHNSKSWNHAFKDSVEWSHVLYDYSNVLVSTKPIPFSKLDKNLNITVGAVLNYVYKDLDQLKIKRTNSFNVSESMQMLLSNKVQYIIMSEIEFNYFKTIYPSIHRSAFTMDKTDIQCTLSKKSKLTLAQLNKSIDHLKKDHVFQNIYNRYLNPLTTPRPINYGLNDSNSPPFVYSDNSTKPPTISGGVFFDLALAVGKKLNRPFNFVPLPRNRLDETLASGEVELICYNAEEWTKGYAKDYYWSDPIFKQSNYIVSTKAMSVEFKKIKSLKDLKGKTIGTALGFVYPTLIPYFKDGSITREDVVSGASNVAKLQAHRVSYIILNNLEYHYYKKRLPDLERAPFEFDPITVKCAVSKKSNLKIADINKAISDLKKSGQLQKVFQ